MGGDVRRQGVGEGNAVKEGRQPPQVTVILTGRNSKSEFAQRRYRDMVSLFQGGHLLSHAPDHLLRGEGGAQHLLAGDAVKDRD